MIPPSSTRPSSQRTRTPLAEERAPGARPVAVAAESFRRQRTRFHAGLRLQLIVALGALTMIAFIPLYLAVANLTRRTLRETREEVARAMGRSVAGRIADDVRLGRDQTILREVALVSLEGGPSTNSTAETASARITSEGVVAVRVARVHDGPLAFGVLPDAEPAADIEVGDPRVLSDLRAEPWSAELGEKTTRRLLPDVGALLAVEVIQSGSRVQVALRVGDQASRSVPLLRLVAFYTSAFALVMMSFAYLLLTRLIVRPIGALVDATAKLEDGSARRIVTAHVSSGAREVAELGRVIARTTSQLVDREEALAAQVKQLETARVDVLNARDAVIRSARLASVGRLAAGFAHEIGNPIAALMGLEDVILMGELDAETRDLVTRMKRETERVHHVLRDLLDFARADQGASAGLGEASVASGGEAIVSEVVAEVVSLVSPQRALRELDLVVALDPALPRVAISGGRLQQILLNLIFNAADAIAPGERAAPTSSKLDVAVPRLDAPAAASGRARIVVRASLDALARSVEILVLDDGPGVDPTVVSVLFEPFVTTKEVGEGTGLGLAVCRGLAEAAGGSIALASGDERARVVRPGDPNGACFVVRLPVVGADA